MSNVGAPLPQLRWDSITSGREVFSGDVGRDGTLVGVIVRSPHPYARIKSIDVSEALSAPGVHAVVTAADLPPDVLYIHHGGSLSDRPPLARGLVRYIGQEVAGVAAETEAQAIHAASLVRVKYRRLRGPLTMAEALRAKKGLHEREGDAVNVSVVADRNWGDIEAARARQTAIVKGRFVYPRVAHTTMETHTTLADWDDEQQRLEIWTSTQAPHFIVTELAHALGLREEQVVCREVAVGGGFGAKSKITEHEIVAAALSRKTCRPVRVSLTRQEEFATTKSRHRFEMALSISADDDGKICAIEGNVDVENGAYNHSGPSVLAAGLGVFGSTYEPIGVQVCGRLVDTATLPGGQFRGYGHPQTAFAAEVLLDELAEKLAIDPFEIRLRNANSPDTVTLNGSKIRTSRMVETLEQARELIGWDRKRGPDRRPGRGVGVASAMQGSGSYTYEGANRSEATVDVSVRGDISVHFGGADAGTGQRTILAQIAADELGVSATEVDVVMMDSETTPFDMGAWSSRGTQMGGSPVRMGAAELAGRLRDLATDKIGGTVTLRDGQAVNEAGDSVSLGDLVHLSPDSSDGKLSVTAEYVVPDVDMPGPGKGHVNKSASYGFATHAVEVEVDPTTGAIRIVDYVAVHDSGKVLNPLLAKGQVVGAVVQGLGAVLGEELIIEGGRVVNPTFLHYPIPRAADVPDVRVVMLDGFEPAGPRGAKSIGELPIVPVAAAVANAVYDAVGVRVRELPITPDKILSELAERSGEQVRPVSIWRRPSRWYIAAMRWSYPRGVHWLLHRWGTLLARRRRPAEVLAVSSPTSVAEAASLDGEILAGGTDVLPRRAQGLAASQTLVSLHAVRDLRRLEANPDGSVVIGAGIDLATLSDVLRSVVPVLSSAADSIATPQIRNMATVGGNLLQQKRCWFYRNDFDCYKRGGATCPCYAVMGDHRFFHAAVGAHRCQAVTPSDLATALIALDADVRLVGRDGRDRTVPMRHLYTGPGETQLKEHEVLTEVRLPPGSTSVVGRFEKLNLSSGDFALVSVALTTRPVARRWGESRLVLGALANEPLRATRTEAALAANMSRADVVATLKAELASMAHPLPGNAWKLDAVVGLTARLYDRLAVVISD